MGGLGSPIEIQVLYEHTSLQYELIINFASQCAVPEDILEVLDCSVGRTFTLCTWKTEVSGEEVRKEFNSQIKFGT